MPRHFCFCLSLKTGAIIMSFLNLLEGSVEIIAGIIELSNFEDKAKFERIPEKIIRGVSVEKMCNKTDLCNATVINEVFPTGIAGVEGHTTLFTTCMLVGVFSVFNGILLMLGLLKDKEKYILLYVLLGSVNLFIVTLYAGINMFHNGILAIIFILSIFMCYGQLAMYYFYESVAEYNTVKSGVIEIAFNGDAKSYVNSVVPTDEAVDNTAV